MPDSLTQKRKAAKHQVNVAILALLRAIFTTGEVDTMREIVTPAWVKHAVPQPTRCRVCRTNLSAWREIWLPLRNCRRQYSATLSRASPLRGCAIGAGSAAKAGRSHQSPSPTGELYRSISRRFWHLRSCAILRCEDHYFLPLIACLESQLPDVHVPPARTIDHNGTTGIGPTLPISIISSRNFANT